MRDRKKCAFFKKPDPGSGSEPDPVFKILSCRIRSRPKMDQIRNPDILAVADPEKSEK